MQVRYGIGDALKDARVSKGISQKEAAKAVGWTSSQYVSNIERGVSNPCEKYLKYALKNYTINKNDLFISIIEAYKAHFKQLLFNSNKKKKKSA